MDDGLEINVELSIKRLSKGWLFSRVIIVVQTSLVNSGHVNEINVSETTIIYIVRSFSSF